MCKRQVYALTDCLKICGAAIFLSNEKTRSLISVFQKARKWRKCDSDEFILSRSFVVEHIGTHLLANVYLIFIRHFIITLLKYQFIKKFNFLYIFIFLLVNNSCSLTLSRPRGSPLTSKIAWR